MLELRHCWRGTFDVCRHHGADGSPITTPLDVARRLEVEDENRQLVVHAERDRRGVHHLQALLQDLQVRDLLVAGRLRVLHRIGGVDAVDLGGLEDDLRLHFHGAQRRGGVGGEVGIAGARREHHDAALFEVAHGAAANERLGHRAHLDGGEHARRHAGVLERVLQRQGVDHRGEHAHVVAGRAVHAAGAGGQAAKDVAAADHDARSARRATESPRCPARCAWPPPDRSRRAGRPSGLRPTASGGFVCSGGRRERSRAQSRDYMVQSFQCSKCLRQALELWNRNR